MSFFSMNPLSIIISIQDTLLSAAAASSSNYAQLGDELCFRASTTGGPVVCPDGGSRAHQLIPNCPALNVARQSSDEFNHSQREPLRALL